MGLTALPMHTGFGPWQRRVNGEDTLKKDESGLRNTGQASIMCGESRPSSTPMQKSSKALLELAIATEAGCMVSKVISSDLRTYRRVPKARELLRLVSWFIVV